MKIETDWEAQEWLLDHDLDFEKFIDQILHNPSDEVKDEMAIYMYENEPVITMKIIQDHFKTNEEKILHVIDLITKKGGQIIIIVGARRHGKTALSYWLAEKIKEIYPSKRICIISPPVLKQMKTFEYYSDLANTPINSINILDEAGIQVDARSSQSQRNREICDMLKVAGHVGKTVIFLTQSTGLLDVNVMRLTDIVFFKPISLIQRATERKGIFAQSKLLKNLIPTDKRYNLLWATDHFSVFSNPLPSFWCDDLSNPFGKIKNEKEAVKFINECIKGGFKERETMRFLTIKNYRKSRTWIRTRLTKENVAKIQETYKAKSESQRELKELQEAGEI